MKIVLDGRYVQEHFPGIGRYVYGLARALGELEQQEVNFEINLLYNPAIPEHRFNLPELVKAYPERLKLIETRARPFTLQEQAQLYLLARKLKAQVWHAPYYIRPYFLPCPSILTAYDVIASRFPTALPSFKARLVFQATTRLAFLSSKKIITISDSARGDIIKFFKVNPSRLKTVPLGVDARFKPTTEAEKEAVRARLNLPPAYILYFGINKPHKNLARLLEAFKIFKESRKTEIGLILAGREDPRYAPELHALVRSLGFNEKEIQFRGEISEEDLPGLYASAQLYVHPALYEGFGLPVLEAMACGTPVICAENSSLPEVAGEAALYFPATDTAAIANRLQEVLGNSEKRASLARLGVERARLFSWKNTARQTLAVYRELTFN